MYLVLVVLLLLAATIAWIRFAPSSLFGIVETSTGYRLEADKFSLTFLPLSINTKQLTVSQATEDNTRLLELADGQASINLWRAIRGKSPFWSLSAKQTTLYLPEITEQPEEPKAPPTRPAPIDIRPYLSFFNIDISNLKIVQVGQDKTQAILISTSIARQNAGQYEVNVEYKSGVVRLAMGSFLEYKRVGDRTKLKLTSDALDLTSLIPPANADEKTVGSPVAKTEVKSGNVPGKSKKPVTPSPESAIAWGWLTTLGKLDLDLSIGKLSLGRNQINNLDASLGFDAKEIRIEKLKGDVIAYVPASTAREAQSQTTQVDQAENKQTDSGIKPVVAEAVPTETIIRETVSITGALRPLALSTQGADVDGKFDLSTGKIKLASAGRFNLNGAEQNKLKLDVKIEKLGSFAPLLPRDLKHYTPLLLKTDITTDTNTYSIDNIQLNFARSDLSGDVYVNSSADILKIRADLKSKFLHYIKPEKSEKPRKAIKPEEKPAPAETAGTAIVSEATAEVASLEPPVAAVDKTETSASVMAVDSPAATATRIETTAKTADIDSSSATASGTEATETRTETTTVGTVSVPATDAATGTGAGADIGTTDAKVAETGPVKAEGPKVFSDKPLDWRWLQIADIDVSIVAEKLKINNAEFSEFAAVAKADKGKLRIYPMKANYGEGGLEADFSLNSLEQGAELKANLLVNNFNLGSLELIDSDEFDGGLTNIKINVTAAGASPRVIAASLNGRILFVLQKAKVKNSMINVFGSDIFMETLSKLNPFAKTEPKTELECALVYFKAKDGVLKSNKKLVVETSKMVIVGSGKIDLNDESIDIRVSPTAKEGIGVNVGSLVKFVKVGGTLAQPSPATDVAGLLQSGATIGLAASTGGASLVAQGIVRQAITGRIVKEVTTAVKGNACEQALKKFESLDEELPEDEQEAPTTPQNP